MEADDGAAVVAAIEAARASAIVEADVATLSRITDEDYIHVETSGLVRTKREFLATIGSEAGRFERYLLIENHIRVYGAVAVVTGGFENTYRAADGRQTAKTARHIRIYLRGDGGWTNISHQATLVASLS